MTECVEMEESEPKTSEENNDLESEEEGIMGLDFADEMAYLRKSWTWRTWKCGS